MDTIMKPKYIFNYLIIAIFKVHLHHNCSCFHSPGSSWKEGCGKLTGRQGLVPLGRLLLLPRPRPGPRKRPLILCPTGNDEHCWGTQTETGRRVLPPLRQPAVSRRRGRQGGMQTGPAVTLAGRCGRGAGAEQRQQGPSEGTSRG